MFKILSTRNFTNNKKNIIIQFDILLIWENIIFNVHIYNILFYLLVIAINSKCGIDRKVKKIFYTFIK